MKITKRQLKRIIKEEKAKLVREFKANDLQIKLYLKDIADSGRRDGLSPGSIKMMLQDEFMDNFGHHTDIIKYKKVIDDISKGLMEIALNERGTGNPVLQGKERAIVSAVVNFVDEYRRVMGMDPNDFGDDRRVRQAVQDVIAGVLGEDM